MCVRLTRLPDFVLVFLLLLSNRTLIVESSLSSRCPSLISKVRGLLGRRRTSLSKENKIREKNLESEEGQGDIDDNENMGQVMRIMTYDRAANERNAIGALNFVDQALKWHRLDDGVMGGQSESNHSCLKDGSLQFEGIINTNGGGFCSIRAPLNVGLPPNTTAIRLRFRGDGKTYKFLLSDGVRSTFGPSIRTPSWQADIPTKDLTSYDSEVEETLTIPLSALLPSFGGSRASRPSAEERAQLQLPRPEELKEIGVMLSLKLSDGSSNPKETFGEGIFPFSLKVRSLEPLANDDQ